MKANIKGRWHEHNFFSGSNRTLVLLEIAVPSRDQDQVDRVLQGDWCFVSNNEKIDIGDVSTELLLAELLRRGDRGNPISITPSVQAPGKLMRGLTLDSDPTFDSSEPTEIKKSTGLVIKVLKAGKGSIVLGRNAHTLPGGGPWTIVKTFDLSMYPEGTTIPLYGSNLDRMSWVSDDTFDGRIDLSDLEA